LGVVLTTSSREKKLRYGNLEDASDGFDKQTTIWIEGKGIDWSKGMEEKS
jgi:hypothetical protein